VGITRPFPRVYHLYLIPSRVGCQEKFGGRGVCDHIDQKKTEKTEKSGDNLKKT
jgi:hypothetical protein